MYLGELASKNLRGALGIIPQLFITIGILCAQVLGIRHILGNNTGIYDWGVGGGLILRLQSEPSVSRLDSDAGFDRYPRRGAAAAAALLPGEPQVPAHSERRRENGTER